MGYEINFNYFIKSFRQFRIHKLRPAMHRNKEYQSNFTIRCALPLWGGFFWGGGGGVQKPFVYATFILKGGSVKNKESKTRLLYTKEM